MQWQVILEYVGHVCFMAGTLKASRNDSGKVSPSWPSPNAEHVFQERRRVKQFLDWLLAQRLCLRNRFFSYQCSVGGFWPSRSGHRTWQCHSEGCSRSGCAELSLSLLKSTQTSCFRRCNQSCKTFQSPKSASPCSPPVCDPCCDCKQDCTEMHIPENCKGWVTG